MGSLIEYFKESSLQPMKTKNFHLLNLMIYSNSRLVLCPLCLASLFVHRIKGRNDKSMTIDNGTNNILRFWIITYKTLSTYILCFSNICSNLKSYMFTYCRKGSTMVLGFLLRTQSFFSLFLWNQSPLHLHHCLPPQPYFCR